MPCAKHWPSSKRATHWRLKPAQLQRVRGLQKELLESYAIMLKPGGRLVYATCSLFAEEGEGQIAAALSRHPGLKVVPADLPGIDPAWLTEAGALRLRPDFWAELGGMDGFFMACLTL